MDSRKRGKLSLDEEKFIRQNVKILAVDKIALHLNRTTAPVERYIRENNLVAESMNEKEALQRKYKLKGQALQLIREERKTIRQRLFLLDLRGSLLDQIGAELDPILSQKLGCVDFLLGS